MDRKALKNLLNQIIIFLAIFLVINFGYNYFFNQGTAPKTGLHFFVDKLQYGQDELVTAQLENFTDKDIVLKNLCPQPNLQVETLQNGNWVATTASPKLNCANQTDITIKAGEKHPYSFNHWNHQLFGQLGTYRLKAAIGDQTLESNQFQVVSPSFFSWIYTLIIYQPIYNALVFFTSITPGYDLGWAIILLTIFIRTILLIPNHKVLKAQKKLQHIQPKIAALKDKHGDDQQKIASETFAIYKEHKVSPFSSCLPILIQLPILIGLFNVIQSGMDPGSSYMLYPFLSSFDLSQVQTVWLGVLDLTKINIFVLPVLVGIMQYIQLRISMAKMPKSAKPSEMETANRTMMYVMPAMMVFFTASVPSGVGLYWTFSTLYGLIQQIVVNRGFQKQETTIEVLNATRNKDKKEHYKEINEHRKTGSETEVHEDSKDDSSDNSGKPPITIIKA